MSKAPTQKMRNKLFFVVFILFLIFAIYIVSKLFESSVVKAEYYRSKANTQQLDSFVIPANRGTIYDATGKILAQSSTVWDVIISPGDIHDNDASKTEEICETLAELLDLDYDYLIECCADTDIRYRRIKSRIDKPTADKITEFKTENKIATYSIFLVENSQRYYPNDSLAANIIGFTNYDNEGVYGLEAYYDDYLKGSDGKVVTAKDASGSAMPYEYETRYDSTDGNSLVLTIDEVLQHYLEKNLETTITQHQVANRATGIIMNAKTGAIMAMATAPGFNLNSPAQLSEFYLQKLADVETSLTAFGLTAEEIEEQLNDEEAIYRETQWKNKAITELCFPGSIFKVITCASALEEEVVNLNSTFECYGAVTVADTVIHCWSTAGHGLSNLTEAITRSCNPAFIAIGQALGAKKFSDYFEAFGFTEKTGIDLPGEASSLYVNYENMGPVELATSSFGQTNKITPIQMITAYAAAINGGYLMTPYVVDKIIDSDGNVIKTTEPTIRRQVISGETSALMREILENVVATNGGSNAYIAGYRIGGKSGTAQKLDDYSNAAMRYVSTFCAFAPADDPEIVMLVIVDEPLGGQYYGSAVAAPVVSSVFKESLEYLGIYPQYTTEELAEQAITVPNIYGLASMAATTKLNTVGLNYEIVGSETGTVQYTIPASGSTIPRDGTVVVYMENVDPLQAQVPSVIGCTVEQANQLITNAGLNISLSGGAIENEKAKAVTQSVEAGAVVNKGAVIEVTFVVNDETG